MRFRNVEVGGWSYTDPMPPIVGKIRLGIKVKGKKDFPKEMDYFIIDSLPLDLQERIIENYGEQPKSLHVALPYAKLEAWFPWSFMMYFTPKEQQKVQSPRWVKCQGNGKKAVHDASMDGGAPGKEIETKCGGENCKYYIQNYCSLQGFIFVMMPHISPGLFQIDTRSQHTRNILINEVYGKGGVKEMFDDRMDNLIDRTTGQPLLLLERRPQRTRQGGIQTIHFPLHIRVRPDLKEITPTGIGLIRSPSIKEILPEPLMTMEENEDRQITTTIPEVGRKFDKEFITELEEELNSPAHQEKQKIDEPIDEPIKEPVAEPIAEPIDEPTSEPISEPIGNEEESPFEIEFPDEIEGKEGEGKDDGNEDEPFIPF